MGSERKKKVSDLVAFYDRNHAEETRFLVQEQTASNQVDSKDQNPPRHQTNSDGMKPIHEKKGPKKSFESAERKVKNVKPLRKDNKMLPVDEKYLEKTSLNSTLYNNPGSTSSSLDDRQRQVMNQLCKISPVPPSIRKIEHSNLNQDKQVIASKEAKGRQNERKATDALHSINRRDIVNRLALPPVIVQPPKIQSSSLPATEIRSSIVNDSSEASSKNSNSPTAINSPIVLYDIGEPPKIQLKSSPVNPATQKLSAMANVSNSTANFNLPAKPTQMKPSPSKTTFVDALRNQSANHYNRNSIDHFRRKSQRYSNQKRTMSSAPSSNISSEKDVIITLADPPSPSRVILSIDPFDDSETNQLFRSNAPSYNLPALDKYIDSFPRFEFSDPKDILTPEELKYFNNQEDQSKIDMFIPMNRIPEGVTVDDLKNNITAPGKGISTDTENNMLGYLIDGVLGAEGSSYGFSFMTLEMLRDFVQFLALMVTFIPGEIQHNWQQYILSVLPNALSLNLSQIIGQGILFLSFFMIIAFAALWWFRELTKSDPHAALEGYNSNFWSSRSTGNRALNISLLFLLTTLYLPLSKLAVDALIWSSSFWPVDNPYLNGMDNPVFTPLGPSDVYRRPDDFCYVTSMKFGDVNFAWFAIPMSIITLIFLTFWFPFRLYQVVVRNIPRIDRYNEMGEKRTDFVDEYERLLAKDKSPYNFIYNGYRPDWGGYKAIIMAYKLFNILIVDILSKDNCLLRSFPRTQTSIIRQIFQIALMSGLTLFHWRNLPYLEKRQNLSEWVSRIGYVITSVIGLLVVLNIPSSNFIGSYGLLGINIFMYGLVFYFAIVGTAKYRSIVKLIRKRLDFSLDLYSARLNYAKHIKRRIWQETWSTLLLTQPEFKMAEDKVVAFSEAPYRPPYLIDFQGSVAERHVENIKIVRQIGIRTYTAGVAQLTPHMHRLQAKINHHYTGPDMYYRPEDKLPGIRTFFGKAYVVPFPFCVVLVYDEADITITLTREWEFERYVRENDDEEIRRRRKVRQMLRALDGQLVIRSHIEEIKIDKNTNYGFLRHDKDANVAKKVVYSQGILHVNRNSQTLWRGHNMNAGFNVTITYAGSDNQIEDEKNGDLEKNTKFPTVGPEQIGIKEDFSLTSRLQQLFSENKATIDKNIDDVKQMMREYRENHRAETKRKIGIMTYGFFISVYNNPLLKKDDLHELLMNTEKNPKLQQLGPSYKGAKPCCGARAAINYLYERMDCVNQSRLHQWWYLFWDDLYRKNHKEIPELDQFKCDFSPAYRSSLPYRPMSRATLETFLEERKLWQKNGHEGFLHAGILNRVYVHLNEIVWVDKIPFDNGDKAATYDTSGTGGVDHNEGAHPNRPLTHLDGSGPRGRAVVARSLYTMGMADNEILMGGGFKHINGPNFAKSLWSTLTSGFRKDGGGVQRRNSVVVDLEGGVVLDKYNPRRRLDAIDEQNSPGQESFMEKDSMSSDEEGYW